MPLKKEKSASPDFLTTNNLEKFSVIEKHFTNLTIGDSFGGLSY